MCTLVGQIKNINLRLEIVGGVYNRAAGVNTSAFIFSVFF